MYTMANIDLNALWFADNNMITERREDTCKPWQT